MPEVWDDILDTETDPDQPLKSSLAKRWSKNFIAMLQGAFGAPVAECNWHPYNKVEIGDSLDGKFYDVAVSGAVASVTTPNFVDGYEYRIRFEDYSQSLSVAGNLFAYQETSAAYTAGLSLLGATFNASNNYSGEIVFPLARRSVAMQPVRGFIAANTVGGWNAHTLINSTVVITAQKILRSQLAPASGLIDSGRFYLDKRLISY